MVRPLLISAGSRGDYEPVTALAVALSMSPEVELTTYFVQSDYISSVPASSEKLNVVELPFTVSDMMPQFAAAMAKAAPDASSLEVSWSALGLMIKNCLLPVADLVLSVAEESKCDVIVTTLCTWPAAHIVAQKLGVPFVMLSLQPDATSRYYPHLNLEPKKAARSMIQLQRGEIPQTSDENIDVCNALHKIHFLEYTDTLDKMCTKLDLPRVSVDDLNQLFMGTTSNLTTILAVQPGLAPLPPDAPENAYTIGSLAVDYIPEGYDPETTLPELCSFLESGDPPIVISYGSSGTYEDGTTLSRTLLSGLKKANVKRAVILPGTVNIGTHRLSASDPGDAVLLDWAKGRLLTVRGNVQYAWLLPQCEMLFCHGGAGCTSAALHAGIPLLITPTVFDQLFFAEIVKLMGVGTVIGSQGFQSITSDLVAKGIQEVRSGSVIEKVQEFSKLDKQGERAVDRAIQIISEAALGKSAEKNEEGF